jgi:hypothetical protein
MLLDNSLTKLYNGSCACDCCNPVELISLGGLDNLTIPISALVLLVLFLEHALLPPFIASKSADVKQQFRFTRLFISSPFAL